MDKKLYMITIVVEGLEGDKDDKGNDKDDCDDKGVDEEDISDDDYDGLDDEHDQMETDDKLGKTPNTELQNKSS
jgi:hypothetical protein